MSEPKTSCMENCGKEDALSEAPQRDTSVPKNPQVLMTRTHASVKHNSAPSSTALLSTSSGPSSSLAISHSPTKTTATSASQLPGPITEEMPIKCTKCSGVVEDTKEKVTDVQGNVYHQQCLQSSFTLKGTCCLCEQNVFGNQARKRYAGTKRLYHAECGVQHDAKKQKT